MDSPVSRPLFPVTCGDLGGEVAHRDREEAEDDQDCDAVAEYEVLEGGDHGPSIRLCSTRILLDRLESLGQVRAPLDDEGPILPTGSSRPHRLPSRRRLSGVKKSSFISPR